MHQLQLCPPYPASRCLYRVVEVQAGPLRADTLHESRAVVTAQAGEYTDMATARIRALELSVMRRREYWVVDIPDDGYIAFRARPEDHQAISCGH